jgi:ComF family protein
VYRALECALPIKGSRGGSNSGCGVSPVSHRWLAFDRHRLHGYSLLGLATSASSGKHFHLSISSRPFPGIGARIRQALLAQDCLLCQAASGDRLLCEACERELPSSTSACPRCALAGSSNAECGACLADPPHYDASCAAFIYTYPVDALIQALKYGGQLALAGLFAHKLQQRIGQAAGVDLIVPLPLHPARLAERGFNQAGEIAKAMSRASGISMDAHVARRVRDTAPQTALPWRERTANMRQAFSCERDLAGLNVAVIDDVMTTGATLNEFARTLKRSGAARVQNWVVARTPHAV